jgi:hypothetical protein
MVAQSARGLAPALLAAVPVIRDKAHSAMHSSENSVTRVTSV